MTGYGLCPVVIIADDAFGENAITTAVELTGFVVVDALCAGETGIILTSARRAPALDGEKVAPVLVYGLCDGAEVPPHADDCLPPPHDPRFASRLLSWAPPSTDTIERLAVVFGQHEAAHLALRLHERLVCVAQQGPPHAHDCHRLGGFAGTLGFVGLHRGLQRLAEGDATASRLVLHQARQAIAAIEALPLFLAKH